MSVKLLVSSCTKDDENISSEKEGELTVENNVVPEVSEYITIWDATEITIPTSPDPRIVYDYNVDWDNDVIV